MARIPQMAHITCLDKLDVEVRAAAGQRSVGEGGCVWGGVVTFFQVDTRYKSESLRAEKNPIVYVWYLMFGVLGVNPTPPA